MNEPLTAPDAPAIDNTAQATWPAVIRALGEWAGTASDMIAAQERGLTPEQYRAERLDARAAEADRTAPRYNISPHQPSPFGRAARAFGSGDTIADALQGAAEALYLREHPRTEPSRLAKPFMGASIETISRTILAERGHNTFGLSKHDVLSRMMTSGDLPFLLANVGNKILQERFTEAAPALEMIGTQTTFADFKPKRFTRVSEYPDLAQNAEGAEFTYGSLSDAYEAVSAYRFAKIVGITREMVINDDTGGLSDTGGMTAEAIFNSRAKVLVALLTASTGAGQTMRDGNPAFHSSRGNIGTTGVISETTLKEALEDMRRQTNLGGNVIAVDPAYLLVPPELEVLAKKTTAAIQATQASNVQVFSNLSVLVEPRLTNATRWYVFSAPGRVPFLRFGGLEAGPLLPRFEARDGWHSDTIELRVVDYYGAGVIEPKVGYTNAGA